MKYLFALLIILSFYNCFAQKKDCKDQIDWLEQNAHIVLTIDPDSDDFSDLYFLNDLLQDKKVILLGEQTHSDASTSLAKTRLIKYLHENLGYNVLLLEQDMYIIKKFYDFLSEGIDPVEAVARASKNAFIERTRIPLFNYLADQRNKTNGLIAEGIDILFYDYQVEYLISDIESVLKKIDSSYVESIEFKNYKSLIKRMLGEEKATCGSKILQELNSRSQQISEWLKEIRISAQEESNELNFIIRSIDTYNFSLKWFLCDVHGTLIKRRTVEESLEALIKRDSVMAENVLWYVNKMYPNQKIIISTSTFHAIRNINVLTPKVFKNPDTKNMGQFIYDRFKDSSYCLSFVSFIYEKLDYSSINESFLKKRLDKEKAKNYIGSIEALLHSLGYKYCLIDFSRINQEGQWLKQNNQMYPTFFKPRRGDWTRVMDGLFYIDVMDFNKSNLYIPSAYD